MLRPVENTLTEKIGTFSLAVAYNAVMMPLSVFFTDFIRLIGVLKVPTN